MGLGGRGPGPSASTVAFQLCLIVQGQVSDDKLALGAYVPGPLQKWCLPGMMVNPILHTRKHTGHCSSPACGSGLGGSRNLLGGPSRRSPRRFCREAWGIKCLWNTWDVIGAQCTPLSSLQGTKTDDHLIHQQQSHQKYQTLNQDSTPSPGSFAGLAFSVFASAQLHSALGARSACGWSSFTELRISSQSTQHGAKDYIQHQGAFSHLILGAALRGRQRIPLFREEETES